MKIFNISHKDKDPELTASNDIYKYTRKSCQAFYISKTSQQLSTRIMQHQGVSALTGREGMCKVQSDIREHCLKSKIPVETDNFSILDRLHSEYGLVTLKTLDQKISRPRIGTHQQYLALFYVLINCYFFLFVTTPFSCSHVCSFCLICFPPFQL